MHLLSSSAQGGRAASPFCRRQSLLPLTDSAEKRNANCAPLPSAKHYLSAS